MTVSEQADAREAEQIHELDRAVAARSILYGLGEYDPTDPERRMPATVVKPGQHGLLSHDPRLKKMPDQPTLLDFFKLRFGPAQHLLQSANLARKNGCSEKIVLACLLHDIGVVGFIRSDHGYWGAQLVEPYVDEEVAWAIRAHQALRFFPDEAFSYPYPEMYVRLFGEDYQPEPYIQRAYEEYRKHKWYGTGRMICVNDLYAFDPNVVVTLEEFEDVVARNFRQPEEGLGFDNSPSAHMWRTINWPTRYL